MINGEWVVLPQAQMKGAPSLTFQNVDIGCLREPQCNPNPCHSGGHCTDRWRDFSCTCERPYLGHTCQYNYTAATFGNEKITNSLVTVEVADYARRAIRSIVDLSMFIRTRQPKGQIFYLGSGLFSSPQTTSSRDTCICAQLESGELNVQIQFDGPSESYTVGGVKLDNGYNHLIEVSRDMLTQNSDSKTFSENILQMLILVELLKRKIIFDHFLQMFFQVKLKSDGTTVTA